MAITYHARGDSFTPRVYGGLPDFGLKSNNEQISVDATSLTGSVWDFDVGTVSNVGVHYSGIGNWPNTQAVSILTRVKFGSLSGTLGLWNCSSDTRRNAGQLSLYIQNADFKVYMRDDGGSLGINNVTIAGHGMSTGVWYDILVTYTGDNTTNGFNVYVDNSLIGSITSGRSWDSPRRKVYTGMTFGQSENVNNCQMVIDEVAIWNEIINPASVTLESGSGALNGASRASLVASTPTVAISDPGIANVRSGTSYGFGGVSLTGTLAVPSADDVRSGVSVDAGTGNLTLPSENDVESGVSFGTNGTEFTGNFVAPTEIQVENGVGFGSQGTEFTGSLATADLPDVNDVRLGVVYGQSASPLTGALNTNLSNALDAEVQSNEIEIRVKTDE